MVLEGWEKKEGKRGGIFGFDQPEQTSQWGVGKLLGTDSHAASSFTSTNGEEGRDRERGRGTAAERRRGGSEGNDRDEKKKRSSHNGDRKLGPKASKVAKGEK